MDISKQDRQTGKKKARLVVQNFYQEEGIDFNFNSIIPGLIVLFLLMIKKEKKLNIFDVFSNMYAYV